MAKLLYKTNTIFYSCDDEDPSRKMDFTSITECIEIINVSLEDPSNVFFVVAWTTSMEFIENIIVPEGKKNILLWIADELGKEPSECIFNKFYLVFKNHLKKNPANKRIRPLPLFTPKENLPKNQKEIKNRELNVFFSGCSNKNRILLYCGLKGIPGLISRIIYKFSCVKGIGRIVSKLFCSKEYDFSYKIPQSIIKFTSGFYKGYSPTEYSRLTSDAKIVLNPRGFHSTECFRMYEAMAAGCVVISEELPKLSIYENIPIYQVKDWSKVYEISTELLEDKDKLDRLSEESYQFYKEHLSAEAIAKYIINTISLTE